MVAIGTVSRAVNGPCWLSSMILVTACHMYGICVLEVLSESMLIGCVDDGVVVCVSECMLVRDALDGGSESLGVGSYYAVCFECVVRYGCWIGRYEG